MLFLDRLGRSEDPHTVLDAALTRLTFNGKSVKTVRARLANYRSRISFANYLLVMVSMVIMTFDLLTAARRGGVVVAREFWNIPLLVVSPLLFPFRRRIYFNVNHNLRSLPHQFPPSIVLLSRLGFRFILFDGRLAAATFCLAVRKQFSTPLFPISIEGASAELPPGHFDTSWVVGVVGDFRLEKGSKEEVIEIISRIGAIPGVNVTIGLREPGLAVERAGLVAQVVGTRSREEYVAFLQSIDILILFARQDRYYCRHSGTIMDAIACYATPVVPNFPVLASQISHPVRVGLTYEGLGAIVDTTVNACQNRRVLRENIPRYLRARNRIDFGQDSF
jgi:hypothetical protein